jgi:hypothetical protein
MSVTSGFYNALNKDRRYNAEQMSAIFDGVINDGVFANVGTAFSVKADTGFQVNVGVGRAWFNSKWLYNDTILPLTVDIPEVLLNRIDAVVIEIDATEEVRAGTIKIVKGTPASSPKNPTLASTEFLHQHPLAYILVEAGATSITQSKITNMVGTSSCPYVTGILQVLNIDNLVAQWGAQWIEWFTAEKALSESERQAIQNQWATWFSGTSNEWYAWFAQTTSDSEAELSSWMAQMKSDFLLWFQELEDILGPDVAATLANRLLKAESALTTLEKTKTMYSTLLDSTGSPITDNAGLEIEGKTVLLADHNVVADNIGYSNDASKLNAHTVQGALDELAARKPASVYRVVALANNWSDSGTNTIQVVGLDEEATILIGVDDTASDEQWTAASNALLRGVSPELDHITLKALGAIPMVDIPILIYAWPKG